MKSYEVVTPDTVMEPDSDWLKHEIGEGCFVYLAAEQGDDALVYDEHLKVIGNAFFLPIGEDDESYLVAGIHVEDRYQNKGIATALIKEFSRQNNDATIYFRPDTGQVWADGSHLTIHGAHLAHSMISKGLAYWLGNYWDDECTN